MTTKKEQAIRKAANATRFSDTVIRLAVDEFNKAMKELTPRKPRKSTTSQDFPGLVIPGKKAPTKSKAKTKK